MRNRKTPARASRPDWRAAAVLVALAIGLAGGVARAAEPFENLMPDGCFVCVGVRSVPDLIDPVKASPQARLLSEPAMQPLLDELAEGLEEARAELNRVLGISPEELLGMLGEQICVGVLPRGDRDAHFLLLADVSGDPELAATVVQNILQHERDEGTYEIREEEFRGHTIYRIEPIPDEDGADDELEGDVDFPWDEPEERIENPGFIALSDGVLALASSPDRTLLERHLVLRAGEALPTVGGSDNYRRVQPFMPETPDVVLFVDIQTALEAAGGEAAQAIGASAPLAFGLGLDLGLDGLAMQGLLLAPGPRTGFARAFMPQSGTVMPPSCVDADAAMLIGLHFSVPVLWEEIKATMQREAPEEYMKLEQGMKTMPVDVENDVINAFGSRWFVYMPASDGTEGEAGTQTAVLADLRDSEAFATAWRQLLLVVPPIFQVETTEFMGVSIRQFKVNLGYPEGEGQMPQPCVAVMADKLLYASGLDMAKTIIRNDSRHASPLLGQEAFQQMLGRTMDDPDMLMHVNGLALGKMMKAQAERDASRWEEELGPGYADEEFGPDDIPWDVLEKYMTDTILTARWIDEGLRIKTWAPVPAQEP